MMFFYFMKIKVSKTRRVSYRYRIVLNILGTSSCFRGPQSSETVERYISGIIIPFSIHN
jgi:hypothetical protein